MISAAALRRRGSYVFNLTLHTKVIARAWENDTIWS